MTRTRLLAALVMTPLAIAAILLMPTPWIMALTAVVFLVGLWEWFELAEIEDTLARTVLLVANLALMVAIVWASRSASGYSYALFQLASVVGVAWWVLAPGELLAGFVHASPPGQGWSFTMWTRDAGVFLRELVLWGRFDEARLVAGCLMDLVTRNEQDFHAFPERFDRGRPGCGHEIDGTCAIVIGLAILEARLPAADGDPGPGRVVGPHRDPPPDHEDVAARRDPVPVRVVAVETEGAAVVRRAVARVGRAPGVEVVAAHLLARGLRDVVSGVVRRGSVPRGGVSYGGGGVADVAS